MPITTTRKVSRSGQVSLPADVRCRWGTDLVLVLDLGTHVVMGPVTADREEEIEIQDRTERR